jgi:ABC-2 type transport system permease protein
MLWYKAWLDTRWRFLIGLALLTCTALANVLSYASAQEWLELAAHADPKGALAREINEAVQLSGSFHGYVWDQVVRHNLQYLWTLFAVLLGADGPLSRRRGALFTLSLPVSRRRLFTVRAASDLLELSALALMPMLVIPLAAPAVGQTYPLADALVHGASIALGGAVFYCLALLLSTVFEDRWRPLVITLALAVTAGVCSELIPALAAFSPVSVMAGESYFFSGTLAWGRLFVWLCVSAGILYAAVRSIETRDF